MLLGCPASPGPYNVKNIMCTPTPILPGAPPKCLTPPRPVPGRARPPAKFQLSILKTV